jgi:hypothetical protein
MKHMTTESNVRMCARKDEGVHDGEARAGKSKRLEHGARFKSKISLSAPYPTSMNVTAPRQSVLNDEYMLRRVEACLCAYAA